MEKVLFETTAKTTRESSMAVARAKAKQHNRAILLIDGLIAAGIVALWALRSPHAYWLTAVLVILMGQSMLRVPVAGLRLREARFANSETYMAFDERGISIRTRVEECRVEYASVTELRGDGNHLVILLRHHTPLCVSRGECADFAALTAFLKEKTGLEPRPLRR